MQLYVADYIADTTHLTLEEHGAYLLILMAMWRAGGRIASDDVTMRQICRVSQKRWVAIKARVIAMLDAGDGFFTQKRLVEEYEKAAHKSAARKTSGSVGGKVSALKRKKTPQANAAPKSKHLPDVRDQNQKKEVKEKKGAVAPMFPDIQFPPWWPTKEWADFVQHRRQIGRPLTQVAVEKAIARLTSLRAAGQDPKAVLDQASLAGWRGLFPVNENRGPGSAPKPAQEPTVQQWVYRLVGWFDGHPDTGVLLAEPKGTWDRAWGPTPTDEAGCKAPPEAWAEFRRLHPGKAA